MELKQIPNKTWQARYNKLMQDPYLKGKYNRTKRVGEKRKFLSEYCPEIKRNKGKLVLDIGPGPGEFLELCREFGNDIIGIDAKTTDCEMGDEYIKLSKLMAQRQQLPVHYIGFDEYLNTAEDVHLIETASVFYIVLQGSIEQVFRKYMDGPTHKETKKSSGLTWRIDDAQPVILSMFNEFDRILEDGGYILIWANGSKNNPQYDDMILKALDQHTAFRLYKKQGKTLHKIRKML